MRMRILLIILLTVGLLLQPLTSQAKTTGGDVSTGSDNVVLNAYGHRNTRGHNASANPDANRRSMADPRAA